MKHGLFLTFEGPDGCGKSTQARLLADYLKKQGHDVILTREPGGTPLAEEIRRVILTPTSEPLDPTAEILLYYAARAQHVRELILPALAEGKIVISDRFSDSTMAYQGYGLGRDMGLINEVHRAALGDFRPDLTFLLDLDIHACNARLNRRDGENGADRIEQRGPVFFQKVREGFLEMARHDTRFVLIDTTGKPVSKIHSEIIERFTQRLEIP